SIRFNPYPVSKTGVRFPTYSHGVPVIARAGETASVTLGGTGRAVIGQAVAPESIGADVWAKNSVALILKVPTPGAPRAPTAHDLLVERLHARTPIFLRRVPDDLPSARAQRRADRRLLLSCRGPREEQVCDIRAGSQQHESDRAQQHQQCRFEVAREPLLHGYNGDAPILFLSRIKRPEPGRDRVHLGPRLLHGHAGLQPAKDIKPVSSTLVRVFRSNGARDDELGLGPRQESRREHPDHRVTLLAELNGSPHNICLSAKSPLPQPMREDDNPVLAGLIFVRREGAAQQRS